MIQKYIDPVRSSPDGRTDAQVDQTWTQHVDQTCMNQDSTAKSKEQFVKNPFVLINEGFHSFWGLANENPRLEILKQQYLITLVAEDVNSFSSLTSATVSPRW